MSLKAGTYIDTPEKEYRAWPAINYSSLSKFNQSQDHALMAWTSKSYFEEGSAFELLVEDRAKGTAKFAERFFLADAPGAMPEDLAGWIERGEDLKTQYNLKDNGERNMRSKKLHAWLDACRDNPGMMPMGKDQVNMLNKMVDNFMICQPFADVGTVDTLADILPHCNFQVPIFWYTGKMRNKALLDCMLMTSDKIYVFDIKTVADLSRYQYALKDYGWIQEAHYTAGMKRIFPGKEIVWRFLVSSKAEPWLTRPFQVDPDSMKSGGTEAYYFLCKRYQAWIDEGRPPKGWKNLEKVRIFFD